MLRRVRFFVSLVIFGLVTFCDWVKSTVKIKMGTIIDNNDEEKRDMDDSGCVQDDSSQQRMGETRMSGVNLLDLSDDVLLYILRHCSPRDLKALGFTCPRLGRLVRERSLWRCVDARSEPCGPARLRWYVTNVLHADTRQLHVRGYAAESSGCLGILNCSRQEAEEEQKAHQAHKNEAQNGTSTRAGNMQRQHACLYISAHSNAGLPRFRGSPLWADEAGTCRTGPDACNGPRFTVCEPLLKQLRTRCFRLTKLTLEYCNVNCNTMNLGHLPPTLTSLSLRGAKCFNLPMDKSFLFKIQDHLPLLESLDVSECDWLEPASLLPLSKHGRLRELLMRDCHKLAEFVAYASLSSRYGFRNLQVLDLRGSPVGDSEVAPLAWLPRLQELKLSAVTKLPGAKHGHYVDDVVEPRQDLDEWETQEPEYFKECPESEDIARDGKMDVDSSSQHSGEDADYDDDDDDDEDEDDDDMNGGSGVHKAKAHEDGECSKSKQDSSTTKRKAENGGGDAGSNGDLSRSKRKKNIQDDTSSSDDDSSKDSEEEMYEKRRCQTIVIVDRRYISDNEDGAFPRYNDNDRRDADKDHVVANGEDNSRAKQPDSSNKDVESKGDQDDNAKPKNEKDEPTKTSKCEDTPQNQIDNSNSSEKSSGKSQDDEKANLPSCSNAKKPKLENDAKLEVNQGASTSKDNDASPDKNDKANNNKEKANNERPHGNGHVPGGRYVRIRHGEPPVIVNLPSRPEDRQELVLPDRVVGVNCYNIRREVIDNQQIYNVEIERNPLYKPGPQVNVNQLIQGEIPRARMRLGAAFLAELRAIREMQQNGGQGLLERNPPAPEQAEQPQAPQASQEPQLPQASQTAQAPEAPQENQAAQDLQAAHPAVVEAASPHQPQVDQQPGDLDPDVEARQAMERARLRARNPNILNLIRGVEPLDLPPPLAAFPPIPPLPPGFANLPPARDENREPRHRVLYVNVGQPANAIGPLPNVIQGLVSDRDNRLLNLSRSHLNPSALVTDAAVRRFGRAAGNDIRFVLVGIPHPVLGPNNDGSTRPERSNLRVLVMNGYRNITDRSLIHLATAAPHLRLLDFRETSVTPQGVENFRSLRPDCEVLFSPYVERKVEWPDEDD